MQIKLYFILIFTILSSSLFAQDKALQKVSLQLNWKNQFEFAGYYMAKEKGFYKELGLDVELREYTSKINIVEDVMKGKSTFGITYTNVLLNAHKVVLLSAIFQSSPLVLLSLKSSHIQSIQDFKNKRIMGNKEVYNSASILSMLHTNGIVRSDMISQKFNFGIKGLINKETDIQSAYLTNETYILDRLGVKYNIWNPKDYGFDFYAGMLFTSKYELKNNPIIVENFTRATLNGWRYALEHIDETVSVILEKYNTQNKTEGALLYEARASKKLILKEDIPLGNINKEKIQRMMDIYSFLGILKKSVDSDTFVYNMPKEKLSTQEKEYLKKKHVIRMCVDPNWMPLEGLQNGKYVGIASEYFDILKHNFNLRIKIINAKNWTDSLDKVSQRNCDIVSLANKTNAREQYLNFTDPYLSVSVVLATKMKNRYVGDLHKIKNKKIAIVENYAFIDFVKLHYPNLDIVSVKNINDGLKKVYEGDVYGYIDALPVLAYELQTKYFNSLKIIGQIESHWTLRIGVRNDDSILYGIMQKAIKSVDEKTKNNLLNKWMYVKYETGTDYTLIYMIVSIFLLILAIGLFFYFKLIRLKNKIENQKNEIVESHELLKLREQELETLASTDSLTKLYNRRYFAEISNTVFKISQRDKEELSIVMLDIDDFKSVNDTYGHNMGDRVLVALSKKLKELSRESDIVCRFGGEEFIMLLPATNKKGAFFIAQKLKNMAELLRFEVDEFEKIKFTVSLGVSEVDLEEDKNIEAAIKRADYALYESKRSGKNRVTLS